MKSNFTYIDLFSGIGGFHIALKNLGGKCLMASDILDIANKTYFENYKIRPYGDISKIKIKDILDHDILCGGFPCQSFSNVGHKGGLDDPRGGLIFEIIRILKGKSPKVFILENVKGLVSINKGQTLKLILKELEKCGYNVYWKVLEAKDYGVPQIRKRLFIVGVKKTIKTKFVFPSPIKLKYKLSDVLGGKVNREFGFTVRIGGRRSGINNKYNWDSYIVNGQVKVITPEQCLLLQGFPKKFKLLGTESQKYYQVGNSVPVTVVNEIVKSLIKSKII